MNQPVQPFDSPLRFLVPSSTRPEPWLVELDANDKFGKCACEHHMFRCQPAFDTGDVVETKHRCPHIRAARDFLLDQVIDKLKTPDGE